MSAETATPTDGPVIPEIGQAGRIVLSIIEDAQKGAPTAVRPKTPLLREALIAMQADVDVPAQIRVNVGDLDDPTTPCEITLFAFSQEGPKTGAIPVRYERKVTFPKSIARELLSRANPGRIATASGKGNYEVSSRALSQDSRVLADRALNYRNSQETDVILALQFSPESREAALVVRTAKELGTVKFKRGFLGRYRISSQRERLAA